MTIHLPNGGSDRRQAKIVAGWNPDTGKWSEDESVGEVSRLFGHLRRGSGETNAALSAGLDYKSVWNWREKGRAIAETTVETDRMDLPLDDRIYVDFAIQLAKSIAGHETDLVEIVSLGAIKDPDLALKVLARRHPHWREQKGVDVTSKGESVVVQDRIAQLLSADPTLAASAEAFALDVERAAGEEGLEDDELHNRRSDV